MQGMKVKIQDTISTVKEKVKEGTTKVQGKVEQATARTHIEKEAAKEREKARKAEAKAQLHSEKAMHRETAGARHGVGHVPLTGPHHHRPSREQSHRPEASHNWDPPSLDKYL